MTQRLSFIIEQLMAAKTIAENGGRYPMLCYFLDLAIVEAEEESARTDDRPQHDGSYDTANSKRSTIG